MSAANLVDSIVDARSTLAADRALLVGVSGIDASGKGFLTKQICKCLEQDSFRVAVINVDGWLNLPQVRFSNDDPRKHFYHHALRLEEMFDQLILPLKQNRLIHLTMNFAEETATSFRPHTYNFRDIGIILLEGIFIFKREFADLFDLKIWVECSFETVLRRAIDRGQEGLSANDTRDAYKRIYFPAQQLHFEIDRPREIADIIFDNN